MWELLVTLVTDAVLVLALFSSAFVALGWGELCALRPGCDKSALGGFLAVYAFMLLRFGLLAGAFATGLARGAVPGLAAPGLGGWLLVLGLHCAGGLVSVRAFERGIQRVQADRTVPRALGLGLGVALPAAVLGAAAVVGHAALLSGHPARIAGVGVVLLALHLLAFRKSLR